MQGQPNSIMQQRALPMQHPHHKHIMPGSKECIISMHAASCQCTYSAAAARRGRRGQLVVSKCSRAGGRISAHSKQGATCVISVTPVMRAVFW